MWGGCRCKYYYTVRKTLGRRTRRRCHQVFRLRKKTMNLCVCDNENRERGVGVGVNATMLSETLGLYDY